MAYIPPHKRQQLKDGDRSAPTPSPIPASLNARFKDTLKLGPSRRRKDRHGAGKIAYAADSIFRWWPVGAASNCDPIPSSFRLEPFNCEIVERREGEKPLVLVDGGGLEEGAAEGRDIQPWVSIAERVVPDLISAAVGARKELKRGGDEGASLYFIARPGKNIFHGGSSVSLDFIRKVASTAPNFSNKLRKTFHTNIPPSYMENVQSSVAPKIGLSFHSEKEYYHIKVFDKSRPDLTITCKCTVKESKQLEIYKIEGNQVRHLVADISCLYKELDLRLLMFTKRKMKTIANEENEAMNELVRSAAIDPDVNGGLRWPAGKQAASERFSVVGVWHANSVSLRSNTMRLKLRHVDRFDFISSIGEVSTEVSLKPTEITKLLKVSIVYMDFSLGRRCRSSRNSLVLSVDKVSGHAHQRRADLSRWRNYYVLIGGCGDRCISILATSISAPSYTRVIISPLVEPVFTRKEIWKLHCWC